MLQHVACRAGLYLEALELRLLPHFGGLHCLILMPQALYQLQQCIPLTLHYLSCNALHIMIHCQLLALLLGLTTPYFCTAIVETRHVYAPCRGGTHIQTSDCYAWMQLSSTVAHDNSNNVLRLQSCLHCTKVSVLWSRFVTFLLADGAPLALFPCNVHKLEHMG